jgi:hypothetical protein
VITGLSVNGGGDPPIGIQVPDADALPTGTGLAVPAGGEPPPIGIEVPAAAAAPMSVEAAIADEPALASAGTAAARPPSAKARTAPPTTVRLRRLLNETFNYGVLSSGSRAFAHTRPPYLKSKSPTTHERRNTDGNSNRKSSSEISGDGRRDPIH